MKKWKGMVGVLACAFLYSSMYLLPYIKYIFYDAIVAATGFTNTQIGITLSVYIVAAIISTVPSGWIADRFPPKKMLVLSGVAHAIFSVAAVHPQLHDDARVLLPDGPVEHAGLLVTGVQGRFHGRFQGRSGQVLRPV